MVLLLIFPATMAGSTVSRLLAEQSEESCPVNEVEEVREEARLETAGWELVDRSAPEQPLVAAREGRGELVFFRAFSPRAAEQLSRNGCGAPLRC